MNAPATITDRPGQQARRWSLGAVLGSALGLAPHLIHHVGLLAGAAVLTGIGGNIVFAVLGVAAMTPMLIRLRRRYRSWWAPAAAVAVFATMFAVSALLVGPAFRNATDPRPHEPGPTAPPHGGHTRHPN